MDSWKRLQENLDLYAKKCPEKIEQLAQMEMTNGNFLNDNEIKEASEWFHSLDLKGVNVLCVCGINNGSVYVAAKEWLRGGFDRFLIILERNQEELIRFFCTELATEMLKEWQVKLYHSSDPVEEELTLLRIVSDFPLKNVFVSALPNYFKEHEEEVAFVKARLLMQFELKKRLLNEYMGLGAGFYNNFYRNMLKAHDSSLINSFKEQFKNIPAIICGAGPSLDKNWEILSTLTDRAIIFAGGTAVNALNAKGINPHLALGLDPNWTQFTRLIANTAFEVPFVYRPRINAKALDVIQGQKIYCPGTGGHEVAHWFDQQLDLDAERVEEGYNVINFSLALAHYMGCSPIIIVGLDLAYEGGQSYASGIVSHALHPKSSEFLTKIAEEELFVKKGLSGEFVQTHMRWLVESMWYAEFAWRHRDAQLINATEGGLGLMNIPNMPLAEAADLFLKNRHDIDGMVHRVIQEAEMPPTASEERVKSLMVDMKESLARSSVYCDSIFRSYEALENSLKGGGEIPPDYMSEEIRGKVEEFHQELAYHYFLGVFSKAYDEMCVCHRYELNSRKEQIQEVEYALSLIGLEGYRYKFLKNVCDINAYIIDQSLLESKLQDEQGAVVTHAEVTPYLTPEQPEENSSTLKELVEYYPDGQLCGKHYTSNGVLHGPSRFWSQNGTLLSENWYVNGKKEGKCRTWYRNGTLKSCVPFKEGLQEGVALYFYPSGREKSMISYKKGIFDGETTLYYPNGVKKRRIFFKNGKKDGIEEMWTPFGKQWTYAEYDDGTPINIAREWYPSGILAREVIYHREKNEIAIHTWNEKGEIEDPIAGGDYFDRLTLHTNYFTQTIEDLTKKLSDFHNSVRKSFASSEIDLSEDIHIIEKELKHLHELNKKILKESEPSNDLVVESVWKSPSSQKEIDKMVVGEAKKLSDDLQNVFGALDQLIKLLNDEKKRKE